MGRIVSHHIAYHGQCRDFPAYFVLVGRVQVNKYHCLAQRELFSYVLGAVYGKRGTGGSVKACLVSPNS